MMPAADARLYLVIAALLLAGSASAAEPLSAKQVKALARAAKTPEEHLRVAAWYRFEAGRLESEAKAQDAAAAEFDRHPASHPVPKGITYGENARNLARYYREQAKSALKKAMQQEALAAP